MNGLNETVQPETGGKLDGYVTSNLRDVDNYGRLKLARAAKRNADPAIRTKFCVCG